MYKKEERHKQFPCDFCNMNECPLDGEKCPAVNLKSFFKTIDPEKVYDAYEEYLKLIGLGGYRNLTPYNNFSLSTREDGRLPKLVYVYTK